MKILYLISIVLLICTDSNGQTSLTLQEAVNYGTNNNVEYKNANLDLQIAQQKVKESISTGLPKIQSSLGVQNYIDLPTTVIPSNAFNPLADPDDFEELQFGTSLNASATIRLDQLIFSATYIAGLKAAKVYKGLTEKITSKNIFMDLLILPLIDMIKTLLKRRPRGMHWLIAIQMFAFALYWFVVQEFHLRYLYMLKSFDGFDGNWVWNLCCIFGRFE